ncbi:MAG TPA: coproporphyrinogen-III oxidase family protein, partial [Polymorphobacter sp.]|nr:coproporphyrinogen-III oxidase family protein [Polymorphobacter sp.]
GLAGLDIAQAHFGRVSFDLIYDRPGQTRAAWQAELNRALGFGTEHLSLYQLTIEPSTAFARLHADGKLVLPDADTSADLFEMTQAMTAGAGLPAYEVSNHARPGAASRHNLAYWRYDDYVGVGPGAHGRRLATATERHKKPENWIAALAATGSGLNVEAPLDAETRATEALLMGLRLADGIDAAHFAARTGRTLDATIDTAARDRLVAQGMIEPRSDRLQLTPRGRPLVNAVLAALHR